MSKSKRRAARGRGSTATRSTKQGESVGKRGGPASGRGEGAESRVAEAVTVAWMLCLLATILASGAAVATLLLPREVRAEGPDLLGLLSGALRFTSIVTGSLCLLLTIVAHRVRRQRPPTAVTVVAVVSGLAVWALLFL